MKEGLIIHMQDNSVETSPSSARDDVFRFIMELIPTTDTLHLLFDKIYSRYGLPVILTDISYHLIAYSGPMPCPDFYWNEIISKGIADPDIIINGYYKDGYMDRISEATEPFDVNWGISAGMRQTTCCVKVNGCIEGICSVLYIDEEKLPMALTLNAAIRSAAEIYIRTAIGKSIESFAPERTITARMLLEDVNTSVNLITNTTIYKKGLLSPGYVIMAMQIREPFSGRLQGLRSSIKNHYPSMLYLTRDNIVYMFFPGIHSEKFLSEQIIAAIAACAEGRVEYALGVSSIFHKLEDRALYIEQAVLALKYGIYKHDGRSAYKYYECYTGIVLANGCYGISPENLILPEIKALINEDRDNANSFYESFKCYIYNRCDMPKTATALFMHRNSLLYRIKRCQEIMGLETLEQTDYERMYICCKILDFMKNIG
ncbi:MAG: helix-turn-helix domain-containing protein [Oscillospiraceae bacterium]|nr:helix-turn-helix domain-containing protein [Oscillospiraceae bacterium]